jgi:ATP-binding protein involved in chromosome partitioning
MKDPRFRPVEVGPNEDGSALRIRWEDGHVSEYLPWDLRVACPCAGCVDEMTGRRTLDPERIDPRVHPLEIGYVGRYALGFHWSDGHTTGIYPFEYLRRLCPCEACTEG